MTALRKMLKCLGGPLAAGMILATASMAQAADLEEFYGHYEGSVVLDQEVEGEEGGNERKTAVDIIEEDKGFRLNWTTIITKKDGRVKKVSYSIHFQETEQDGTFSSAMKKNMFGKWIPLNPLKGDPYVWATLAGDTLSVYALIIPDEGGYEMQQYDRTLRADGNLDVIFKRIKDSKPLKTITGLLTRQ
ncbi:hypothetical protein [Aestuariispira insulae]|nr:hypothetical protein [Aestuariispira insulae]